MKGLFIKDCMVVWREAKVILILAFSYTIVGVFFSENTFWPVISTLLMATLPITALGYDERNRWDHYEKMLPYSAKEIVLNKYILGLAGTMVIVILYAAAYVTMSVAGAAVMPVEEFLITVFSMFISSCFFMSFSLPIIFKLGAEKGRLCYMLFMFGTVGAVVYMLSNSGIKENIIDVINGNKTGSGNLIIPLLCLAAILLFFISSVLLSVKIYNKNEF